MTTAPKNETASQEPGARYYVEHGWSGCDRSAWNTLTPGTKDAWRHAEEQCDRARRAEQMHAEAFQIGVFEQGRIRAAIEVLDEYRRSCNPAPFTSERALYERISNELTRPGLDGGAGR